MSIESIVRPFQTPDASPSKPFFTAGKAAPPPVKAMVATTLAEPPPATPPAK